MEKEETRQKEVVEIELPAPPGWMKKFTPKKGGTPRRKDIVFTAPTGEKIKSKKQLDQYLKSHPGGPSSADFDWGTGDTPRRSSRLSRKSETQDIPEIETPKKKQKKSSEKKVAKEKNDDEGIEGNDDKDAFAEGTKCGSNISMADAENTRDADGGELTADGASQEEHNSANEEGPLTIDMPNDATSEKLDDKVDGHKDATAEESKNSTDDTASLKDEAKVTDSMVEQPKNATAVVTGTEVAECKEAISDVATAKVDGTKVVPTEVAGEKGKESDCVTEVVDMKSEELKGDEHADIWPLDAKVDSSEAAAVDNGKGNQAETYLDDPDMQGIIGQDYWN